MTGLNAPTFDSMTSLVSKVPDQIIVAVTPPCMVQSGPHSLDSPRTSPHRRSPSTTLTPSKSRRSLASLARERTSTAFASLTSLGTASSPSLRSVGSTNSLIKHSVSAAQSRPNLPRSPSSSPSESSPVSKLQRRRTATSSTIAEIPMSIGEKVHGRMHQTSSKILRMTDDDRPFTRDFMDLFSTLITSLPLTAHRVRFSRVEATFLAEEAITNLGSLKFSQSNRIPDPKNPSRWVVTTTTTTFSMAKEMARSVCQRFVDARLIESAESKTQTHFAARGTVWQLTPKGTSVLARFCSRNGIFAPHIEALTKRDQMRLVTLERDHESDKLSHDKSIVEIVFRRFMGQEGPNLKSTTSISDSDSVSEYASGLIGVKMAKERRVGDKIIANTFTGRAASDWLLDCCTTIDRRETYELAELFVQHHLIIPVIEDRNYVRMNPVASFFQPTKFAIYTVTEKGQSVCGWIDRPPSMSSEDSHDLKEKVRVPRDSNVNRLNAILQDPALRLLFKEFLRTSLCEENLHFYLDVHDFTATYRHLQITGKLERPEPVRETLAAAYGLYNSFLASGAPSELNIDHALRSRLDSRMVRTDSDEESMRQSLDEVVELFEVAQASVFKLMASDSVPKFIRDPRQAQILREHEFDIPNSHHHRTISPASERTLSRSNTSRT